MHASVKYVSALGSCAVLAVCVAFVADSEAQTAPDKYAAEGAGWARVF